MVAPIAVRPIVLLDADMTSREALNRLAHNGLWLDAYQEQALEWIDSQRALGELSFDEARMQLEGDPSRYHVVIACRRAAHVHWHALQASVLLAFCQTSDGEAALSEVLSLDRAPGFPTAQLEDGTQAPEGTILFEGDTPVAVLGSSFVLERSTEPFFGPETQDEEPPWEVVHSSFHGLEERAEDSKPSRPGLWPWMTSPDSVGSGSTFELRVGLRREEQSGTVASPFMLPPEVASNTVVIDVELIADGVDPLDGWTQSVTLNVQERTATEAVFRLRAREPAEADGVHLTRLHVRLVFGGAVCAAASRALTIGAVGGSASTQAPLETFANPMVLDAEDAPADLTIEIAKAPGVANGHFLCKLVSRHAIDTPRGPFEMDLGDDAQTFAKKIMSYVRLYSGHAIIDVAMSGISRLIAEKLPSEVFAAIHEIAALRAPDIPSVLFASAEAYVPWELARLSPPLNESYPPFLGCQVRMGKWPRTQRTGAHGLSPSPKACIPVEHFAVMHGRYPGMQRLPGAEKEAAALIQTHDAISVPASLDGLLQVVTAQVSRDDRLVGGVDAVHFAGHGTFDPVDAGSAAIIMSDGKPLISILFRGSRYGGSNRPLMFVNACMVGAGGEMLGNASAFPGDCLEGGFGAFLGALWAINDRDATDMALEFWDRALPSHSDSGEPVGAILRDLRKRYARKASGPFAVTYLAYAYYGHPNLTLRRRRPETASS